MKLKLSRHIQVMTVETTSNFFLVALPIAAEIGELQTIPSFSLFEEFGPGSIYAIGSGNDS